MKVMVVVKANPESEAGKMPSTEVLSEMGKFNEQLVQAGVLLAAEGLHPTSKAKRVAFEGKNRSVIDGPFAETKELIAGYWIWKVDSIDDAVEWLKKSPFQEGELDIRPIFSQEDFGDELTPELREQETQLASDIEMQQVAATQYLFFSGQCEQALEFYKEHLGAKVGMIMRFNESPDPLPEGMLKEGFERKIMHSEFTIGSTRILASDGCNDKEKFDGFRIALSAHNKETAEHLFEALSQGGRVDMPLGPTFFSPLYGQVTDQFGLGWIIIVPGEPQ